MEFIRESAGKNGESLGKAKLYVNDKVVAEGPMKTQAGKFTLSGDGLCVGYDSGDAVSQEYKTPGTFKGGTIFFVGVTVEKTQYSDLEQEAGDSLPSSRGIVRDAAEQGSQSLDHGARRRTAAGASCCA